MATVCVNIIINTVKCSGRNFLFFAKRFKTMFCICVFGIFSLPIFVLLVYK